MEKQLPTLTAASLGNDLHVSWFHLGRCQELDNRMLFDFTGCSPEEDGDSDLLGVDQVIIDQRLQIQRE